MANTAMEARKNVMANIRAQVNERIAAGDMAGDMLVDPTAPAPPADQSAPATQVESTSPGSPQVPSQEQANTDPLMHENGLYFGKYKTREEAAKGVSHLMNYDAKLKTENEQLKAQFGMGNGNGQPAPLQPSPTVPGSLPGAEPRVNPAARDWKNERTVAKLAQESGLSVDDFAEFAQSIASSTQGIQPGQIEGLISQALQKELAPFKQHQSQLESEAYIRQNYPDAPKFQAELQAFLETADPGLQHTANTLMSANDFNGAFRLVWGEFQNSLRSQQDTDLMNNAYSAEGQRKNARANAASPSSTGTPVHAADPNAGRPDPKLVSDLAQRARNGDIYAAQEYRRLTFGKLPGMDKLLKFSPLESIPPGTALE